MNYYIEYLISLAKKLLSGIRDEPSDSKKKSLGGEMLQVITISTCSLEGSYFYSVTYALKEVEDGVLFTYRATISKEIDTINEIEHLSEKKN